MTAKKQIIAIILAAGSGQRMKMAENKQFINIGGARILERTLRVFEEHPKISDIIVVMNKELIDNCRKSIIEKNNFAKIKAIIPGGKRRQDSLINGLKLVKNKESLVLVHDGARPFIDAVLIDKIIENTLIWGSAIPAVKVKDTVKKIDFQNFVASTPDRENLWAAQTPQGFIAEKICRAMENAQKKALLITDDSSAVELLGEKVKIVEGSYDNIKITTPDDILLAETIIKKQDRTKS